MTAEEESRETKQEQHEGRHGTGFSAPIVMKVKPLPVGGLLANHNTEIRVGMDIRLDSRSEHLIERQLQCGRYHSPEQVVATALDVLAQNEPLGVEDDERRRAVQEMLAFSGRHCFTLGEGLRIRDLIHVGPKY